MGSFPDAKFDYLALLTKTSKAVTEAELLSDIAIEVKHQLGVHACDILLREKGDVLVLKASTNVPEWNDRLKLGRGVGLVGQALVSGQPKFISEKAGQEPQFANYPGFDDADSEGFIILPMTYDHSSLGILLLRTLQPWPMTDEIEKTLVQLSEAVSACVLMFRHAYDAGVQTSPLGALSEVSKTIATSPYVEEILQLLVNLTAQQFNYRVCTVRLLDERRGELVLRATQASAKAYQRKRAIKLGESIAGRAIAQNRPIIIEDVQTEEDYIGHDLAVEQGLRSMICVPLMMQESPVGVLSCYTDEKRSFSDDEVKALETLAKQAAVSIEHAKLQVRHTLMQEMHHRVKNNLQQVASLLRLQMRHGSYKSLDQALNDCLTRILAIASVHDLLSREDLDLVSIRSIAESLVQHQQSSLVLPDRSIRFEVRGDDVTLNVSQATQIALVLNELIQNAVEHGFKTKESGDIHVTVEEKEGEIQVWVSNSGDQLPPEFDAANDSHLGLQIVDNLARALGGRFKIEDVHGWTVSEVKFHRATGE